MQIRPFPEDERAGICRMNENGVLREARKRATLIRRNYPVACPRPLAIKRIRE